MPTDTYRAGCGCLIKDGVTIVWCGVHFQEKKEQELASKGK